MSRILVVDDDPGIRDAFSHLLGSRGHEVLTAGSGEAALEALTDGPADLVLLDVLLPGMDGLQTFRGIKVDHPALPVIVMTGSGTMDVAIEASKLGAFDYQPKPFDPGRMLESIDRALESARTAVGDESSAEGHSSAPSGRMLGGSPAMQRVFRDIGRVAETDATVLIRGESGTGKELVAEAIHRHSRRGTETMVVVNCAAIPETLLESELFGFERGSFTGASGRRVGMFERADRGSILLDEIGELPPGVQAKILRVLQDKAFERIGGHEAVRVDVRILAATNRDLERAIADGRFREDLYHRLHVATVHVPPLRARREDIPELAQAFLSRYAQELGIRRPTLSEGAMALLCAYPWPGNVRELQHCLHRALIFHRGMVLQRDDLLHALEHTPALAGVRADSDRALQDYVRRHLELRAGPGCEPELLEVVEKELLTEALRRSQGNQTRAAELLGIPRPTLHAKLRKHGIRTSTRVVDGSGSAQADDGGPRDA